MVCRPERRPADPLPGRSAWARLGGCSEHQHWYRSSPHDLKDKSSRRDEHVEWHLVAEVEAGTVDEPRAPAGRVAVISTMADSPGIVRVKRASKLRFRHQDIVMGYPAGNVDGPFPHGLCGVDAEKDLGVVTLGKTGIDHHARFRRGQRMGQPTLMARRSRFGSTPLALGATWANTGTARSQRAAASRHRKAGQRWQSRGASTFLFRHHLRVRRPTVARADLHCLTTFSSERCRSVRCSSVDAAYTRGRCCQQMTREAACDYVITSLVLAGS